MRSPLQDPNGAGERMYRPTCSVGGAVPSIDAVIASIANLEAEQLRLQWRNHLGGTPPAHLPRWLLARVLAQRIQIAALGDIGKAARRAIREANGAGDCGGGNKNRSISPPFVARDPATRDGVTLRPGAILVREWNGALQRVMVMENGFAWNGETYRSLSQIAKAMTGTSWNGRRFFGLRRTDHGVGAERNTRLRAAQGVAPLPRCENGRAPQNVGESP